MLTRKRAADSEAGARPTKFVRLENATGIDIGSVNLTLLPTKSHGWKGKKRMTVQDGDTDADGKKEKEIMLTINATVISTPTVAEVRRLPQLTEFSVPTDDAVFTKGDTIFIRHDGMDGIQVSGDAYYKMTIETIHRDEDNETIWIMGAWCYSASDMKKVKLKSSDRKIVRSLGMKELVKSDHLAVVDALSIEYICYMHKIDDTGTTGFPLKPDFSWFNRLTLHNWNKDPILLNINLHCRCQKFYNPKTDVQRFCTTCERWFHEGCMSAVSNPALLQGTTATEILQAVPYVRGRKSASKISPWTTVGTGGGHEIVRAHAGEINLERSVKEQWQQWNKILSAEDSKEILAHRLLGYVDYVQKTKVSWFKCPVCKGRI